MTLKIVSPSFQVINWLQTIFKRAAYCIKFNDAYTNMASIQAIQFLSLFAFPFPEMKKHEKLHRALFILLQSGDSIRTHSHAHLKMEDRNDKYTRPFS